MFSTPDVRMDRTYDEIVQWVREQDSSPRRRTKTFSGRTRSGSPEVRATTKEEEPGWTTCSSTDRAITTAKDDT